MPPTTAAVPRARRAFFGWGKLLPSLALCLAAVTALAQSMTGHDAPIPDSRFPTYVKFAADPNNNGFFSNQARTADLTALTALTPPIFWAGFFRPMDFFSFGQLISYGNQDHPQSGLTVHSMHQQGMDIWQWYGLTHNQVVIGHNPIVLDQWSFIAGIVTDPKTLAIYWDGQPGTQLDPPLPWPVANRVGSGLAVSFGSHGQGGSDATNLNGGLRDWAVVRGLPTSAELERMRNGEDPIAIWGKARVWGYWHFTANPQLHQKEPDVTGNGHDLTYSDAGSQAGHTLPILVTPAAPARPTPVMNR